MEYRGRTNYEYHVGGRGGGGGGRGGGGGAVGGGRGGGGGAGGHFRMYGIILHLVRPL